MTTQCTTCGDVRQTGDAAMNFPKEFFPCVYVIECEGLYKIGRARILQQRLRSIRNSRRAPIELVHTIYSWDYDKVECSLHRIFTAQRVSGEWFNLSPQDLNQLMSMSEGEILSAGAK